MTLILATSNHSPASGDIFDIVANIANQTSQEIARAVINGAQRRHQQTETVATVPTPAKLEQVVTPATIDEPAGTFHWTDNDGREYVARFFVRTCTFDGSQFCAARRQADYNLQFTQQWYELRERGCKRIRWSEESPNRFF